MKFTATECEDVLHVKIEADKELLDEFAKNQKDNHVWTFNAFAMLCLKKPTPGRCWVRRFIDAIHLEGYLINTVNVAEDGKIDVYCAPRSVQDVIGTLKNCVANY